MSSLGDSKFQGFEPTSKLPRISLTRSGLPVVVLPRHRRVLADRPTDERSRYLVRLYQTAFSIYKIIKPNLTHVSLASVVRKQDLDRKFCCSLFNDPCSVLSTLIPDFRSYQFFPELGSELFWTASPTASGQNTSALFFEKDLARFCEYYGPSWAHFIEPLIEERYVCPGKEGPPGLVG